MRKKDKKHILSAALVLFVGLLLVCFWFYLGKSHPASKTEQANQAVSSQDQDNGNNKKEKTAQELLEESKEAYQKKDLQLAESLVKQAESKDKNAETYNLWGNILRDLGQKEEAKAKYQQAMTLDKNFVTAYLNLATLYQEEEKYDEALDVINEGLKYNPNNEELLNSKNLIEVLKLRSEK